jgi:hypothetical protein
MLLKKDKVLFYSKLKLELLNNTLKFKLCKEEKLMLPERELNKLTEISTFQLKNGLKLMNDLDCLLNHIIIKPTYFFYF